MAKNGDDIVARLERLATKMLWDEYEHLTKLFQEIVDHLNATTNFNRN